MIKGKGKDQKAWKLFIGSFLVALLFTAREANSGSHDVSTGVRWQRNEAPSYGGPVSYGASGTVGEALEPCDTPSTVPGAIVLSPATDWQKAIELDARFGDTFLLREGTYQIKEQLRPKAGAPGQPITIKPYNCEPVTLKGTLRPHSHNTVAGMRLETPQLANENWVIRVDGKNMGHIENVVIRNNTILGGDIDALRVSDDVVNLVVSGNHIDGGRDGHLIFVVSENLVFRPDHIVITNNLLTKAYFDTPAEDMLQVRDGQYVEFTYNTCANGRNMEQCIDIKSMAAPMIIRGNFFDGETLHQEGAGEDGAGGCMVIHETDGNPEQHLVEDNYFKNCGDTALRFAPGESGEVSKATVRRNVFASTSSDDGVVMIWQADGVEFTNNTIVEGYLKLGDAAHLKRPRNTVIKNNIFYKTRIDDQTMPPEYTYECKYSLIYQTTGTGFIHAPCTDLLSADPLFVDPQNENYHLQPGSPARGAGEGGVDLGAYPYEAFDRFLYLPLVPGH
ncbi:MAG TPA: hypothetical protein VF177_21190 [Anaerolineae bacterium]